MPRAGFSEVCVEGGSTQSRRRRRAYVGVRARERDACALEWGSAQATRPNCENYNEWIYLLIFVVPLLWTTAFVNK